ncbi:MAG: hypothetical protein QM726_13390 [Chitinophagaceae bacterium]
MKKAILYMLLFAYSSFLCRPLMPAIADCIAHIFWYSEHVATVHYENGKYHLHYENIDAAKKSLPEKNTLSKYDDIPGTHPISRIGFSSKIYFVLKEYNKFSHSPLLPGFSGTDFPPPKA